MLKFIFILLLIYFFFKAGKILLRWYIGGKLNKQRNDIKSRVNEKFKDADDAQFIDYVDPEKKKNKE